MAIEIGARLRAKTYFTGKPCKHGHVCARYVTSKHCVICSRARSLRESHRPEAIERAKAWRRLPDVQARDRQRSQIGSGTWVYFMLAGAKHRAKRRQLPFDSNAVRELLAAPPPCCPVFKTPFVSGKEHMTRNSPTLDRIVPALGYVRGNIALICARANSIKNDATAAELRAVADWLDSLPQKSAPAVQPGQVLLAREKS